MADQNRIAAISVGLNSFVFDIGSTNAVNGAVDAVRGEGIAIPILKDKSRIAVYNRLIKAYDFLLCPFCAQRLFDFFQHGDDTGAGLCLWRFNMETGFGFTLIFPIYHVVVDADNPVLKVAVLPAQANDFTNAATSSQKNSKERTSGYKFYCF